MLLQLMLSHAAQSRPEQERSAPILLLRSGSQNFAAFYAEILRSEGFNAFDVAEIEAIDANMLDGYDVSCMVQKIVLYFDMYHCPEPQAHPVPPGFSLAKAK